MLKKVSPLSLGCSRFGSLRGTSEQQSMSILDTAIQNGVNFFDTAASYGQGDSERYLGKFYKSNPDIYIATKLGKVVPIKAQIMQPVKNLLRALSKGSKSASEVIKKTRGDKLSTNFELSYISKQFDSSRKRLSMESIPVVYLHSPTEEIIRRGDAVEFLAKNKKLGNIQCVGVSVDDMDAAEAALLDNRIEVIQIPVVDDYHSFENWCTRASANGKFVIAREILRNVDFSDRTKINQQIYQIVKTLHGTKGVKNILIGTTNSKHLIELVEIYRKFKNQ